MSSHKNRRNGSGSGSNGSQGTNSRQAKHPKTGEPPTLPFTGGLDPDVVMPTDVIGLEDQELTPRCPPSPHLSSRSSSPAPPNRNSESDSEPPSALADDQMAKLFQMLSTKFEKESKATRMEISGLRNEFKGEIKKVSKKQDAMDRRMVDCTKRVSALEGAISNAENIAKEAKMDKEEFQVKLSQVIDDIPSWKGIASMAADAPVPLPSPPIAGSSDGFSNFSKPGRSNAITCNLEGSVHFSRAECEKFFTSLLQARGLACQVKADGFYETSKRFTVLFSGPGNVGQECVNCLLRARKDSEGKWVPHTLKIPSGDSTRVFYDLEKSHKQIKLESITNSFSKLLCERYGEKWCFARKDQGKILREGIPMVQLSVTENSSTLQWFRRFVNKSPDYKEGVDKLFQESFGEELCS